MQIKFRTALITGSSRGLGRQIAVKLAMEGVKKIAVHYRTGGPMRRLLCPLIEAAGASGVLVQGDVADAAVAESLVKEAAQKLGGCDIYVQSVVPPLGEIYEQVMATELSLEKWQIAFDTQARAFFVCARTAAKFMSGGGRIVGLSYTFGGRTGGMATMGGHGQLGFYFWREPRCSCPPLLPRPNVTRSTRRPALKVGGKRRLSVEEVDTLFRRLAIPALKAAAS